MKLFKLFKTESETPSLELAEVGPEDMGAELANLQKDLDEAKATHMVSKAIAAGDVNAINYFVAQSYLKEFGKFANSPNQKTLILPMEATNILGSLAGITELAKEFKSKGQE